MVFASGPRNGHALDRLYSSCSRQLGPSVGGPYSRDASALRNTYVPAVSFLR